VEAEDLKQCQEILAYEFSDISLLEKALTHASVAVTRVESNERMEFLGDAVLGLVVVEDLYRRYDDLMEGEMTKIKSLVVSREMCAQISDETGLSGCIHHGKGLAGRSGLPMSICAAVLESVIGAIYLDGGMDPARQFILRLVQPHIEEAIDDQHKRNYKSLMQQHAQRKWNTTPAYLLLDEKGPDHSKCFEVAVSISGRHYASAWGKNKKEAEQKAALLALRDMGVITEAEAEEALGEDLD